MPEHLHRTERWNGLRSGDPVVIKGIKERDARWEFRAHVRNDRTGAESIEVIGGRNGDRKIRSFRPEQVFPVSARSRHPVPASLAEAPQLPFG